MLVVETRTEGEDLQLEVVGKLASQSGMLNHPILGFDRGTIWLDSLNIRVSNLEMCRVQVFNP